MLTVLALLAAAASAQSARGRAADFVLCDSGIRCRRAPCLTTQAMDLHDNSRVPRPDVDVAGLRPADRARVNSRSIYEGRLVVSAVLSDGRLIVSRIVRTSTPQERRLCRSLR